MITAFVMVEVEAASISEAAQEIADLPGVDQVYSCAGDIDLIVVSKLVDHAQLAELVPGHISRVHGVKRTATHIAFQSFAKRDGEDAFSIGQ